MSNEKVQQAWWSDTKSNLLTKPPKVFGDEVTGLFDAERLAKLKKVGKVSFEPPESEEKADLSKTSSLEKALKDAENYIKELEKKVKATPKNATSANKKVKKLEIELTELKKSKLKPEGKAAEEIASLKVTNGELETQAVNKSVIIDNLVAKVDELADDLKEKLGDGLDEDLTKKLGEIDELAKKLSADPADEDK